MEIDWERVARAFTHPVQQRVLELLASGKSLPPVDLAREIDASIGVVAYHVTILAGAGLIELDRIEQVRGAVKHYYRLTALID